MELVDIKNNANHRGVPIIRETSHDILVKEIKKANPQNVLEIGTAVGYSGIEILKNSNATLVTIEHNSELVSEANKNFKEAGFEKRAKVVCADCVSELAFMLASDNYNEKFDFIFLDGPKAQYQNMIDSLIMMLAPGGTILVDNVLFRGYVTGEVTPPTKRFKTIIARLKVFIDDFLNRPELENAKLISVEDGMLVATKKRKNNN
ncbi:MAG: O-methyltransferase [Clostridia bacterium]|nr:O-methyltransferase [Clostridia bacterium]